MINPQLKFAGLVLAGFAAAIVPVKAQGPLYDKVIVDLPYRVTLNETTLEPGHYVIRQLDSPGGASRVLQIFTDNGMRLKTSAQTIPALDNRTPSSTKVILHHYGNDYYFDKVWIQGKDYGYEFPLPNAVKSRERERMEPYTVAATYEPTPAAANQAGAAAEDTTTVTQAAPAPTPAPEPAPSTDHTIVAQNTPPATVADSTPAPVRETAPAPMPTQMPHTAGNWLTMLLSGGALSSAGYLLRRVRS
ncbi:MAG: hypothetical protein M3Z09_10625 [Acidobacteriota bacterium]|nr:hypothetical protein [Acidobacteriota bacterium]